MSDFALRPMEERDRLTVIGMMRDFYSTDAVKSDGSEEVFTSDVNECLSDSPYASAYVFTRGDGSICGYSMLAHSFGTEFGKPVIWIEELYLEEDARGQSLANMLFDRVMEEYPDHVHRLEVEEFNLRAVRSYKKNGFTTLPYTEMIRGHEEEKG